MNHTNLTHALLKDASVTIQKGNLSVTIGHKQAPAPVKASTIQPVPVTPSKPVTVQDVAFVLVLVFLLSYVCYRVYRYLETQ